MLQNTVEFLSRLSATRAWEIVIRPYVRDKTDPQNKSLWGLAYPILERATGQDAEDWHEYFCGEKFGWVEKEFFGKRKLRPARTTTTDYDGNKNNLNTIEFAEFFDFIQRRCAENGVHIPDPDPFWREQLAKAA